MQGVQQLVKNMSALNANMEALAQGGEEIAHFSHAFRRFYAQVAATVPVAIAAASASGSSPPALDDTDLGQVSMEATGTEDLSQSQ
jgi:hypothetical protein